jgi:hypothetical protein
MDIDFTLLIIPQSISDVPANERNQPVNHKMLRSNIEGLNAGADSLILLKNWQYVLRCRAKGKPRFGHILLILRGF